MQLWFGAGRQHTGHRQPAQVMPERHAAAAPTNEMRVVQPPQRRQRDTEMREAARQKSLRVSNSIG